jgi:tryptophan synthase alpha chain
MTQTQAIELNRLDKVLAADARPAIACYFPIGDPQFDDRMRNAYWRGGADILELGIPARNPFLDGPDVAGAMGRALASGTDIFGRLDDMMCWLAEDDSRPAGVAMAYVEAGLEPLLEPARLRMLDGALVLGEGLSERGNAFASSNVRTCGFVSAALGEEEIAAALDAPGYVMLQAVSGATGPRASLDQDNREKIARLRASGLTAPILLGFGISTPDQARQAIDMGADGIVVGSMCVRMGMQGADALEDFLGGIRAAVDA